MTPDQLSKMTPEEKRMGIAKLCGWKNIRQCECKIKDRGLPPQGRDSHLPEFLNDLNAMHAAEMGINDPDKWDRYYDALDTICEASEIDARSATAAQRADALLLTRG